MKNVSLIANVSNGKPSWRLLDQDGLPIKAFDGFAKSLESGSVNTRKNYCRWLAEFFDYLYEAALACGAQDVGGITQDKLIAIIESYDSYLVLGGESGNDVACMVELTMPSPRLSQQSSSLKHAAIRKFLRLSERVRQQLLELTKAQADNASVASTKLFPALGSTRAISVHERQGMLASSMIAGVISGGPKLIQEMVLPVSTPDNSYSHAKAFPFDSFGDTVSKFTSYRDAALYSFCAASGCRISEAIQLLWADVDTQGQKVFLIDPKKRPHDPSYLALTSPERSRLVWKGRATHLTLLIEPFVSVFFSSLAAYLRHEYIPHGNHKFIFQYSDGVIDGRPYFLAAASSRNGVLQRAMKLANVTEVQGPHSFRHMYGTYLLNYFPRPNGQFGLPPALVQKLMGHAEMKSTMKYARYDKDLIEAELTYANQMVFGTGSPKSLIDLKKATLLSRLAELEQNLTGNAPQGIL
ncbi:tyrosine-type recombinase/integrase [Undibacterium sp.]|uniref:tyrosine-type recombinase/integrase n=1 Tax=Undibacterium sp. TaxID=1914977 RepID=UPI0025F1C5FD|nr:tyrosine-type recombinase/integrase [Undibacterium sp.]